MALQVGAIPAATLHVPAPSSGDVHASPSVEAAPHVRQRDLPPSLDSHVCAAPSIAGQSLGVVHAHKFVAGQLLSSPSVFTETQTPRGVAFAVGQWMHG